MTSYTCASSASLPKSAARKEGITTASRPEGRQGLVEGQGLGLAASGQGLAERLDVGAEEGQGLGQGLGLVEGA